ncbi:2183_t:CDS:2 [Entrophospora sp. SA101]|nr:13432_t:CDS:2 [Entrophospora sp. SA101]CAJ0647012.1 2183_t:CDS:2 [Entrophospora sp. SA101]CAJ0842203.1 11226_t:CDS:2 [Entrophospora sp. SA101]CAJ0845904.1 9820_t:CDS:2 [Entrophospora sp. SA101]
MKKQDSTNVKKTPRKTKIQELLEKGGKLNQEEIKEIFDRFDYNGNGILSLAEIDKAIAETYPLLAKDKPALMRAYKAADASKDGFIDSNEFGRLLDLLYYYNDVYKKFKKLDKNNDKRINYQEFKEGHKMIGIKVASEKDLKAEFDKIDANGGGYILFDEFCLFVSKKKQHDDKEAEKAENVENAEKPIEQ